MRLFDYSGINLTIFNKHHVSQQTRCKVNTKIANLQIIYCGTTTYNTTTRALSIHFRYTFNTVSIHFEKLSTGCVFLSAAVEDADPGIIGFGNLGFGLVVEPYLDLAELGGVDGGA